MNKLTHEKRAQILHLLMEGNSMRATASIADIAPNSVAKFFIDASRVCANYQDKAFRNLSCKKLQLHKIWSFIGCKQKNVPEDVVAGMGDVWTWIAIDADTKLVPSWRIGDRGGDIAKEFVADLASRLANRVQITTDGHKAYLEAVEGAFGQDVDYAMLVKLYGEIVEGQKHYSPAECVGIKKTKISGNPDLCCTSTSFVERQNLTMRMSIRRFTRLTNAFSKKVENYAHSVALHYMHYNFCRIHKALRMSPAMAADVDTRLWSINDIVDMVEATEKERHFQKWGR
ncbi:MAG: IS1 family transposase [Alphaproteobacteria bacterium]